MSCGGPFASSVFKKRVGGPSHGIMLKVLVESGKEDDDVLISNTIRTVGSHCRGIVLDMLVMVYMYL